MPNPADRLTEILLDDDVAEALWASVDAGEMHVLLPEFSALRMEQDPIHRHKDVMAHTIAVVAKTRADLRVRLAALLHDIGKPRTRRIIDGEVTFRHHEAVGARMTTTMLASVGYDHDLVVDVARLVELSGRFKGYADGWSDAAVRRYARDAGPLLGDLNHLVRCDCTTRNPRKVQALQAAMDDLEFRIVELAKEDARNRERPDVDGQAVMDFLDIDPGPAVGEALKYLLAEKRRDGELGREEALRRLKLWWTERDT